MMNPIFVIVMMLNCFFNFATHGAAQDQPDLNRLQEKLARHVASKLPGWRHKRGEPMQGSKNVLIDLWGSSNRVVKVSIVPYSSIQEAREVLRGFLKFERQKEELRGFGDEAYGWGYGMSNVVLARGRFIIYVSTYAEVDADPEARMLSQAERRERERSEVKRLSREFAKHMVDAIDLP